MPTWMGMPLSVCFWTELQQESFWLLPHFCCCCWALVALWVAWAELEVEEDWVVFIVVDVCVVDILVDFSPFSLFSPLSPPLSPLSPVSQGLAMATAAKAATTRMENCMLIGGWGWIESPVE